MPNITRRNVLRGGAAVGVAGAVTVAGAGQAIVPAEADRELIALERAWLALREDVARISDLCDEATATLPAWARPGPDKRGRKCDWAELDLNHPAFKNAWLILSTRPSLDEVESHNRECGILARGFARQYPDQASDILERERNLAPERVNHWQERRREQKKLEKRAGVTALNEQIDRRWNEIADLEDRIEETPAQSLEGVAIKLRVYEKAGLETVAEAAAADAARLTGRAS